MISYQEYKTQKEAEHRASTTNKSTLAEEEDWDMGPSLPPWETPLGAHSMAPSQEDEWKLIINQDPHLVSIAWHSGHGTMTATGETESTKELKQLIGAVGGLSQVLQGKALQMLNGGKVTHCLNSTMIML